MSGIQVRFSFDKGAPGYGKQPALSDPVDTEMSQLKYIELSNTNGNETAEYMNLGLSTPVCRTVDVSRYCRSLMRDLCLRDYIANLLLCHLLWRWIQRLSAEFATLFVLLFMTKLKEEICGVLIKMKLLLPHMEFDELFLFEEEFITKY